MKHLLILPFAVGLLAACASSNDNPYQSPQASADCTNLTGSALLECQRHVEPTSNTTEKPFKMVKPRPVNGRAGQNRDMKDSHDH